MTSFWKSRMGEQREQRQGATAGNGSNATPCLLGSPMQMMPKFPLSDQLSSNYRNTCKQTEYRRYRDLHNDFRYGDLWNWALKPFKYSDCRQTVNWSANARFMKISKQAVLKTLNRSSIEGLSRGHCVCLCCRPPSYYSCCCNRVADLWPKITIFAVCTYSTARDCTNVAVLLTVSASLPWRRPSTVPRKVNKYR